MTVERKPRSWWSTALVSFFSGPFGGFLWIGNGTLAVLSLIASVAVLVFSVWHGFPAVSFSEHEISPLDLARPFVGLLSIVFVLPFRRRSRPVRWYSHGAAVIALMLVSALLPALAVRCFVMQSFWIPASSMEPSLVPGDYLFADKRAYGYSRYSVPFGLLPVEGRLLGREPQRGDIVIFRFPPNPQIDYVKRVIGFPDETVQMIGGVLQINGIPVKLEEAGTYTTEDGDEARVQRETLPNGISYSVLNLTDDSIGDDTQPFKIPEGTYFMLGDNRDNSADSRFNTGFVPYENLVGRVAWLYWNSRGVDYSSRQIGATEK